MDGGESADLVVIGAGVYGLAVARTYLQVNPAVNVVILESGDSVGGVWAKERLYPDLKMNNLLGTYEYSDFPMDCESFGVKKGEHVPGEVTHRYLQAYAQEFGIYPRIQFGCKVEAIEKKDDRGWLLAYNDARAEDKRQIFACKLIIATGIFTEPAMPEFEGMESFDRPLIHSKEMAVKQEKITGAKSVVILAASKSGYDAAYMAATRGVEVDWIVRKSGRGPVWMAPAHVTPLKRWLEQLVNTRVLSWLSPCTWGDADGFGWIRRYLHGTSIGRVMVDAFWKILGNDALGLCNYDAHPETKKLKPWTDAFWAGTSFSILNYPTDFYDLVREGKIKVHVSEITHLSPGTVHLCSGEAIECDALVCGTGWKSSPAIKFLPEGIEADIGLPNMIPKALPMDEVAFRANAKIREQFPRLDKRPIVMRPNAGPVQKTIDEEESNTKRMRRFRLYRHMVPHSLLDEHNIGFAGVVSTFSTVINAQIQALWLTAYLDGKLPSPSGDVAMDTARHSEYGRLRYPFGSPTNPDFVFDFVPYADWLLGDLGLKIRRKPSLWAELFSPYGPEDYRGIVEEWQALSGVKN